MYKKVEQIRKRNKIVEGNKRKLIKRKKVEQGRTRQKKVKRERKEKQERTGLNKV